MSYYDRILNGTLRDHGRDPTLRGEIRPYIIIPREDQCRTKKQIREFIMYYYQTFRLQEEFDNADLSNNTYPSTTLRNIYDCFAAEWKAKRSSPPPWNWHQFWDQLEDMDEYYMYKEPPLHSQSQWE